MGHFEDEDARWHRFAPDGPPAECWEWRGSLTPQGYGLFTHNGVRMAANRAALMRAGVILPRTNMACHHCDNRKCVNPEHLYVGDALSNMADAWNRNRFPSRRGDNHPGVRIPDADLESIRQRVANGETQTAIAKEYGVSQATVSRVVLGKRLVNV